jgi:hypothetical protein
MMPTSENTVYDGLSVLFGLSEQSFHSISVAEGRLEERSRDNPPGTHPFI